MEEQGKAKSEKRKAKSEKRKAKSEKRKAKSEKRKAKSEKLTKYYNPLFYFQSHLDKSKTLRNSSGFTIDKKLVLCH